MSLPYWPSLSIKFVCVLDLLMINIKGMLSIILPLLHGRIVLGLPSIHSLELVLDDVKRVGEGILLGSV